MREEVQARREIVEVCHLMAQKNLITATDGNVSIRLESGDIIITPSGVSKGEVASEELIRIDDRGKKLSGWGEPSSETEMHLEVYRRRADVNAVVHGHPPTAIALTVAGLSLIDPVLPEIVLVLEGIPTVPYATPGTGEAARVIGDYLVDYDALLLDRHGSLTMAKSVKKAYHHLEKMEHAAHVVFLAHQLGEIRTLPPSEVKKLRELRSQFGISPGK